MPYGLVLCSNTKTLALFRGWWHLRRDLHLHHTAVEGGVLPSQLCWGQSGLPELDWTLIILVVVGRGVQAELADSEVIGVVGTMAPSWAILDRLSALPWRLEWLLGELLGQVAPGTTGCLVNVVSRIYSSTTGRAEALFILNFAEYGPRRSWNLQELATCRLLLLEAPNRAAKAVWTGATIHILTLLRLWGLAAWWAIDPRVALSTPLAAGRGRWYTAWWTLAWRLVITPLFLLCCAIQILASSSHWRIDYLCDGVFLVDAGHGNLRSLSLHFILIVQLITWYWDWFCALRLFWRYFDDICLL